MASLPVDEILRGLNDAQKAAVSSPSDVVQVLAPPGSGKTKTLTARVAYLITHHGLDPGHIIVCTFTVKAAREMQERIEGFIGAELAGRLILGTFHSVARRLLVKHGRLIGLESNFDIADSSDSKALITRIIKDHRLDIKPNVARNRISAMKSDGLIAEDHVARSQATASPTLEQQQFDQVFSLYEDKHKVDNVLDYDDLLLYCRRLLTSYPHCVNLIDAVLIDEFQDTNNVQFDLMKLLAQRRRVVTIVGDPDQSIYGWRSAQIGNLMKMRNEYPDTHVVNLEENYRSSACILLAAQEIIEQDGNRHQKSLLPTHSAGEQPVLRRLRDPREEACWITDETRRIKDLTGGLVNWNDFAVLIRSAFLSRVLEQALGRAGIPYRMVGGHRFYDRTEVKIVLDYLRCISHTNNTEAMLRVLNVPSRKLGDKSLGALLEKSTTIQCPLWKVVLGVSRGEIRLDPPLNGPASQGLDAFVSIILWAQKKLQTDKDSPIESFARQVMEKLQFQSFLEREYRNEDTLEARKSNVDELMTQMKEVDESFVDMMLGDRQEGILDHDRLSSEDPVADRLAHFLAQVALSTDKKQTAAEDDQGQLTISTMHAAKGLEWPIVFIPAVYQGSVPHSRAEDHDEERRLLYVAMTRAQALLYLSCPTTDTGGTDVRLSQFLDQGTVQATHMQRGPPIGYDLVRELAKILRREERKLNIETGRALAVRLEDDFYPELPLPNEDESSPDHQGNLRWNQRKRPTEEDQVQHQSFAKRPATSSSQGFISAKQWCKEQHVPLTGFRTAKVFHEESAKENTDPQRSFPPSYPAQNTNAMAKTASIARATDSKKKLLRGQSTLGSFFGRAPSTGKEPAGAGASSAGAEIVRHREQTIQTVNKFQPGRTIGTTSLHRTTMDQVKVCRADGNRSWPTKQGSCRNP